MVLAYGTDKPDLRSTATVTITVDRNLNGPRFFPQSDSIELPETTSTDFWSMPQNVSDPDSVSYKWFLTDYDMKQEKIFVI